MNLQEVHTDVEIKNGEKHLAILKKPQIVVML